MVLEPFGIFQELVWPVEFLDAFVHRSELRLYMLLFLFCCLGCGLTLEANDRYQILPVQLVGPCGRKKW